MSISESEISQLTESIWTSLLGLEVRRSNQLTSCPPRREPLLTSCVHITGVWQGAVTVECSMALARRVASIMFGIEPEKATAEETRDALGELAHITGGT